MKKYFKEEMILNLEPVRENEIRFIYVKKDPLTPHKHFGLHPYVVLKATDKECIVAPCSSAVLKRSLPTQVKIETQWDKPTAVLLEQTISLPTEQVQSGRLCATLCEKDIKCIHKAFFTQMGIFNKHNVTKGKIYSASLGNSADVSQYIVISNEACNKFSPVVHVLPMNQKDDEQGYFSSIENLKLVTKSIFSEDSCVGKISDEEIDIFNNQIAKIFA